MLETAKTGDSGNCEGTGKTAAAAARQQLAIDNCPHYQAETAAASKIGE